MPHVNSTEELLATYRTSAIATGTLDPKANNQNADRVHDCYKLLRQTDDGRNGILMMIRDKDPFVRLWAAAHSLQWVPEKARSVLEELRDGNGPASFTAKWTLKEFDDGALTFDF